MAVQKTQGEKEAMDVAEASRETEWEKPSFVGDLFLGKLNLDLIHPFPEQPADDKAEADEFLSKLERFIAENVDADKIDADGEYDYSLFDGLGLRFRKPIVHEAVEAYAALARRLGISLVQLALGFVKSRWHLGAMILGATSIAQLEEDIAAAQVDLDEATLEAIAAVRVQYANPAG